jgi:hypothetical protein
MGAFVRLYTFLSQIFDYGNTAIEKRAIFYKRLIPLLEFGREREGIDLSKVKLTHHTLRSRGTAAMPLGVGEKPLLDPVTEAGSGSVQAKEKAYLRAIIEKLNTLFEGDLTDDDQLVYVNHVIMGKLLESARLVQQATNNTKEQFANSPDLRTELRNALMEALDAHTSMSSQALNSPRHPAEPRPAVGDPARPRRGVSSARPRTGASAPSTRGSASRSLASPRSPSPRPPCRGPLHGRPRHHASPFAIPAGADPVRPCRQRRAQPTW